MLYGTVIHGAAFLEKHFKARDRGHDVPPRRVPEVLSIYLPRPRDIVSGEFISSQKRLAQMVMEEQMRDRKGEAAHARRRTLNRHALPSRWSSKRIRP